MYIDPVIALALFVAFLVGHQVGHKRAERGLASDARGTP